jgi:hypothetical protein
MDKKKPTIAELEAILNSEDNRSIRIDEDGYVVPSGEPSYKQLTAKLEQRDLTIIQYQKELDVYDETNKLANEHMKKLKVKLEEADREIEKLITERDLREEQIDEIADALGDKTEWSNLNDRGLNAVELAQINHTKLEEAKGLLKRAEKWAQKPNLVLIHDAEQWLKDYSKVEK